MIEPGFYIIESLPTHYYSDGSIGHNQPAIRTVVQVEDENMVCYLGSDCTEAVQEMLKNNKVIRQLDLSDADVVCLGGEVNGEIQS